MAVTKKVATVFMFLMMFLLVSTLQTFAKVEKADKSTVDLTNTADGYISITCNSTKKIKVQVSKGDERYNYDLRNDGKKEVFPLQMGDGSYRVQVLENVDGSRYSPIQSVSFTVKLKSEIAPFLVPNQQVWYTEDGEAVKKAKELTANSKTEIEKVNAIVDFVVNDLSYDTDKAQNVKSGYVPSVDDILKGKKGICFDYASLATAMLRSVEVPSRLVKGYVAPDGIYHAWIEVFFDEVGWVAVAAIDAKDQTWQTMDPTFLSSSKSSQKALEFIGNGSNYSKNQIF